MFRFYRTPRRSNNDQLAHIPNGTLQIDHAESVFYHRPFEFSSTALFAEETRPNVPRARRSRDDVFAEVGLRHRALPVASRVSPSFATTENWTEFCPVPNRRYARDAAPEEKDDEVTRFVAPLDRPTIFPRHGIVAAF